MIAGVSAYGPLELAQYAIVLWLALMALRLAWVYASAYLRFRTHWGWTGDRRGPDPRRVFLVGWAAVRGSITLATALSVPYLTSAGMPFPYRDLVVFLAASTIILTLALNGVPLPWLIRKLAVEGDDGTAVEEQTARIETARAGARAVERALTTLVQPEDVLFGNQLLREYQGRIELHGSDPVQSEVRSLRVSTRRQLRLAAIAAERAKLYEMRDQDVINDETRRRHRLRARRARDPGLVHHVARLIGAAPGRLPGSCSASPADGARRRRAAQCSLRSSAAIRRNCHRGS